MKNPVASYGESQVEQSTDPVVCRSAEHLPAGEKQAIVDAVARRNVLRVVTQIRTQSQTLDTLAREGRIAIVGAMYDVVTGEVEFLTEGGGPLDELAADPKGLDQRPHRLKGEESTSSELR